MTGQRLERQDKNERGPWSDVGAAYGPRPAPSRGRDGWALCEFGSLRCVVGQDAPQRDGKPNGATSYMLTTTTASNLDIVQRLLSDRPSFHRGGTRHWASLPETLHAILASVKRGDVTLETGVGASTVVFAAGGATHTAISPDPQEHQLVREYCQRIGVDDSRLTFIAGFSEDVLPSLLSRERTLDAAFIDGAHSFPFPEVDWCYITRSLKPGARLVLDDITIPSVEPVHRHMVLEPNWRLESVLDDRAAAFTLLHAPRADDFWPAQQMNSGYPDFSFAAAPKRLKLATAHRVTEVGHSVARRSPTLRRIYKQVRASRTSQPTW
jgi:predicted O-methyltransferase YrrM